MAYEISDRRSGFLRKTAAYYDLFVTVASPEQKAAADKVWLSAIQQVNGLYADRDEIQAGDKFTDKHKKELLAAWATKTEALKRDLLTFLKKEAEKPGEQIANLIAAADGGLVWHPELKAYTRKTPTSSDPQAIADATEARAYWRSLPPQQFIDLYRQWVTEDDPRARIAEADPTGVLVPERIREWARRVRVERSPYAKQIEVLKAAKRSFGLLYEAIEMELARAVQTETFQAR